MRHSAKEQTVLQCQNAASSNDMQEAIAWSASDVQPELLFPAGTVPDQRKLIPRKTFH